MAPTGRTFQIVTSRGGGNTGTWAGFLAAAFCLVGLIGLFTSYAAPLPYQREMRREAVLDQLLATPAAQRETLRDALGDSADAVLDGHVPLVDRVAAERLAMRRRFASEAADTAQRLRLLIVITTLVAALIGAVVLGLQRKG